MGQSLAATVSQVCADRGNDPHRLLDILRDVQQRFGCVSGEAMESIAAATGLRRVEVESVVSFYSFLDERCAGRIVIRVCNDIVDRMAGADPVLAAFADELGIAVGETTPDGAIRLETTPCIGMSDQAPAALVNDVVVTSLSTDRAREIVRDLRQHMEPEGLVSKFGDGNNAHDLVHAMVQNNLRLRGEVIFGEVDHGQALGKALAMSSAEVIRAVNNARLRGRGGAGFPAGMKWQFARDAEGDDKVVICNADEGEPGTFKDRVILTERPDLLFAGMTIAGYAIGAHEGILYLRGEYAYLLPFLEDVLAGRRREGQLGAAVGGKTGFDFDIRIQMGAGSYVCGEETALIHSAEGGRGDPKTRPPFPAQEGYLGRPTVVNNVESLCCVAPIIDMGPGWFARMGTEGSSGTKLVSVSGDCRRPGVYEVEFGMTLSAVLELAGARDTKAVQVGGPSGRMVGAEAFGDRICFDELATGGSLMIFGQDRDLLEVVHAFTEFFVDESCGYCTPCRAGNALILRLLEAIMAGRATAADLQNLERLAATVKRTSRCGLGQTSSNPVLTTLKTFRADYEARLQSDDGQAADFDLDASVGEAAFLAGRPATHSHA